MLVNQLLFSRQVDKELEVVLNLTRKMRDCPIPGVRSILTVPKLRGRIYVEALAPTLVQRLCNGICHVYLSSIFPVPIVERLALLAPADVLPSISKGQIVTIRNGLYAGDVGEVMEATEGSTMLVVKLKSRQPNRRDRKRKRGKGVRREPYLLDRNELESRVKADKRDGIRNKAVDFEDLGSEGFLLNGKHYSNDGHLLLEIQADRVERMCQSDDRFMSAVATKSQQVVDDRIANESVVRFIHPGNMVRITEGPASGAIGRAVDVMSQSVIVNLVFEDLNQEQSTLLEIGFRSVKRHLEIGTRVEVKVGELKGWTGYITSIQRDVLHVVNVQEMTEVSAMVYAFRWLNDIWYVTVRGIRFIRRYSL